MKNRSNREHLTHVLFMQISSRTNARWYVNDFTTRAICTLILVLLEFIVPPTESSQKNTYAVRSLYLLLIDSYSSELKLVEFAFCVFISK